MSKLIIKFISKAQKLLNNFAFLIALVIIIFGLAAGLRLISEYKAESSVSCLYERLDQPSNEYCEINKYYEFYYLSKYHSMYSLYFIFDKDHSLLDYDVLWRLPPEITVTSEGLIEVYQGVGTGVHRCKYYDPDKRLISEWFFNPIALSNSMIVDLDIPVHEWRLVVQNVFDKSVYYRTFERDFSNVEYPVTRADFINNGKQLRITYKAGLDEHEVTETLDLYD